MVDETDDKITPIIVVENVFDWLADIIVDMPVKAIEEAIKIPIIIKDALKSGVGEIADPLRTATKDEIKEIQKSLKITGHYEGDITGDFNLDTKWALFKKLFDNDEFNIGDFVDGAKLKGVDDGLLDYLKEEGERVYSLSLRPANESQVRALQTKLLELGYNKIEVNGRSHDMQTKWALEKELKDSDINIGDYYPNLDLKVNDALIEFIDGRVNWNKELSSVDKDKVSLSGVSGASNASLADSGSLSSPPNIINKSQTDDNIRTV